MSNRSISRLRTFHDDFKRASAEANIDNAQIEEKPITSQTSPSKTTAGNTKPAALSSFDEKPLPAPDTTTFAKTKPISKKVTPKADQPPKQPPAVSVQKPKPIAPETVTDKVNGSVTKNSSQLDVSKILKTSQHSILDNKQSVFDVTEAETTGGGEGDIISDTKRSRFRLIPAIIAGIKQWFVQTEDRIEKARAPKHLVSPAEERADVIATAAKKSALAPNDDYRHVAKRLSSVKRNSQASDLAIKDEEEIEPAHWAYANEETPEPEVNKPAEPTLVIPRNIPQLNEETENNTEGNAVESNTTLETTTNEPKAEPETPPTPEPPAKEPIPTEPVIPTKVPEPIAEPEAPPEPEPEPETAAEPPGPTLITRSRPAPRRSLALAPVMIATVAIAAAGLGVATTFWLFGGNTNNDVVAETETPTTLIESNEQISVQLATDRLAFMKNIIETEPRALSEITVIHPTINVQGSTEVASVSETLSVLSWRMPSSLTRNITDMNFGLWKASEPFIVLKITSFDIALGGMLASESSLSSDLSPLFGSEVTGTFDPNSRSATQIRDPYFIDSVLDNHDVRILRDELYKERIVYSFIDKNTILITNSNESFRALAPYVK